MWRRNVLFISLPSQPSSTNGLGTRACLMGSSNSPLVSKEAMQPWKPDFDSKGRGNVLYMWGRTPPAKNFNTIIVRKAVELEFDSTSTQFHLISCQFFQLNWVGLGLENATSLVMSKSSNHMVKPCLQVAKDLSAGEQMHLLISPILCACFWSCVCPIITLEQHPNETAARKRKKSHYCMPLSSLSRMCHCSSLDALFTKQAARSMLTKRRVGSNLKGSLNWQVTETE